MSPSKDSPPSAPKIALKGFSLSAKPSSKPGLSSSKPKPSTTLGKRPRSTFAAHDSDSDSDHERKATHEVVTGFGAEGAIRHDAEEAKRKSAGPLVIEKLKNRDWKAEARKRQGKNLLPAEVQAARARQEAQNGDGGEGSAGGKMEGVDVVNGNDEVITWGLSVRKRVRVEEPASESTGQEARDGEVVVEEKVEVKPLTADEEALQALLGAQTTVKGPDLIISATREESATPEPMNETDAYKRAVALAPDVSTLEDYERVPVEEFGAALLRGMGWKGEKVGGGKEVVRRQNLLGLGAKELKGAEELGAWVQKSDTKRLRPGTDKGSGGGFGGGGGDRRPKASEYRREKERREEKREERGGGSYRRERERDSYRERDRDGHRRH